MISVRMSAWVEVNMAVTQLTNENARLRGLMNEWEYQGGTRDTAYRDDLCARWLAALAPPDPPDAGAA